MALAIHQSQDFGSLHVDYHQAILSWTAGAAGDDVVLPGSDWVDTLGLNTTNARGVPGERFYSCSLVIHGQAALGPGESLTLKNVKLEHAPADAAGDPDVGNVEDFEVAKSSDVVLTATGRFTAKYDFYVLGANQFIRGSFQPDLSRANTDTAVVGAVLVMGGTHVPADVEKA